jgi:hypothetical protein
LLTLYSWNYYEREKPVSVKPLSETPLTSLTYGLDLFAKRNSWGFKLGVHGLNFEEIVNYQDESHTTTYDTSFVLVKRNFETSSHGKTIALVKKVIEGTTDTTVVPLCTNCKTVFSYIEIPLSVQREWGWYRFKFFAQSGIGVSFLQKAKGMYSTDLVVMDKGSQYEIDDLLKSDLNKTLFSTSFKLGLSYAVSSKFAVFGSYGYRFQRTSLMKAYVQKPTLRALIFGVEINL